VAKPLGDRLPDEVRRAFDGHDLERKVGPAHLLVTVDPDGAPRPCMLSAGELLTADDRHLRLLLWAGTGTSRNLAHGGPVLLCYVEGRDVVYVKGRPRPLPSPPDAAGFERFEIEVQAVETDRHEGLPVTGGITFGVEGADRTAVARNWERQLAALRA
jgi:hypothetical protein